MSLTIPKARQLYKGDINETIIEVQNLTGIHIDSDWWEKNVGDSGSSENILERFDQAYDRDFGDQIEKKSNN